MKLWITVGGPEYFSVGFGNGLQKRIRIPFLRGFQIFENSFAGQTGCMLACKCTAHPISNEEQIHRRRQHEVVLIVRADTSRVRHTEGFEHERLDYSVSAVRKISSPRHPMDVWPRA